MSKKKQLEQLLAYEADTRYSFDMVKRDILFLLNIIETEKSRVNKLESVLENVVRELRKSHKRGHKTGNIYPTLAGKVKALAEHAGIEFGVEPREVKPTKVVAQKKAKK